MDNFLQESDDLSRLINEMGRVLYVKNQHIPVKELKFPGTTGAYFSKNHNARPFFSIQTAAELLYRSIKMVRKPVSEIVLMDYGAGVGNLYILAKMIGCKTVIYNDLFEDMTEAARIVSQYLDAAPDVYITADTLETMQYLLANHLQCDIIISRNLIEHIYDLKKFYSTIFQYQPNAVLYFSTTANYHNPVNLIYHKYLHGKFERSFCRPKRKDIIKRRFPDLNIASLEKLTDATRGLAVGDLDRAMDDYAHKSQLPDPSEFGTNTCDPENGMWVENIIPRSVYAGILNEVGYQMEFLPAFWDTHYANGFKNVIGKSLNVATKMLGKKGGLLTTAFIYVIAYKK